MVLPVEPGEQLVEPGCLGSEHHYVRFNEAAGPLFAFDLRPKDGERHRPVARYGEDLRTHFTYGGLINLKIDTLGPSPAPLYS